MRVGSAAQVHVYGFTCVSKGLRTGQRVNVRSIGCTLRILGSRASTCTAPDAESAKVQTHSPQTACFQRFSPDGSPVSQPHRLKLRPRRHRSGGIAPHGGPTRRRHADAAFRMAQNPHHHRRGAHQRSRKARPQCPRAMAGLGQASSRHTEPPSTPLSPHFRYKTLPAHPKWPNLAQSAHAGRVLYRFHHHEAEQGEFCTEREAESRQATTAHQAPLVRRALVGPGGLEGPEGPEGPEGTGGPRAAGTHHGAGGRSQDHSQTNFACNSIGPNFNKPRKRCNSNDANSMFEQAAGELHAKVMIDSQNWATWSNPGPRRGAGGRRQGLAGQRVDAPSEARSADGSRAGRRPQAPQAARPKTTGTRHLEHPWAKQPGPRSNTCQRSSKAGTETTGGVPRGTPPVINTRSFNRG